MRWQKTKLDYKDTPAQLFTNVCRQPGAIFLESQRPSFAERYSIIAWQPEKVFKGDVWSLEKESFFRFIDGYGKDYFVGGYMGYETCHWIERLPRPGQKYLPNPTIYLAAYATFLVYDHMTHRWFCWHRGEPLSPPKARADQMGWMMGSLEGFDQGKAVYLKNIKRILAYIKAGDVYQINYTQRMRYRYQGDPYALFLRLKQVQPVAYAAFINLGEDAFVISGSPELFLRVRDKKALSKPMKGTRKRSPRSGMDKQLREELKTSRKDLAENTMIVDVMRNDLGRCCDYGSIRIPRPYVVESYNTVYQMVTHVQGTISNGVRHAEVIRSTFPPASITGAPKVRAMEIISELEPSQRGVYCGIIGYFFQDNMVMNVAIRTLELHKGQGILGIGGGIVADSNPEMEYEESVLKAKATLMALGID